MPIYEYKCDKCGVFEVTQRITENSLKKCPTCKSKVERIISATSFVLKGTGWYVTDYPRAGAKTDSSTDSAASGANGGTSSSSEANGNGDSASSKTTSESTKSASDKAPTKTEKSASKADKSAGKSSD
jgi:putative FmdB family regulatory protein